MGLGVCHVLRRDGVLALAICCTNSAPCIDCWCRFPRFTWVCHVRKRPCAANRHVACRIQLGIVPCPPPRARGVCTPASLPRSPKRRSPCQHGASVRACRLGHAQGAYIPTERHMRARAAASMLKATGSSCTSAPIVTMTMAMMMTTSLILNCRQRY